MKRYVLSAIVAAAALASVNAQAGPPDSGDFNVVITLTSKCQITTAAIGNLAMSYVAFGSAATGETSFNVRCTAGLPLTMTLDQASITDGATGLAYTLALNAASGAGAVAPVASLGPVAGVAGGTTYYVAGNIAAGQAGTAPAAANNVRTVTLSY